MVRVLETAIDTFFARHSSTAATVPGGGADGSWGQLVPGFSLPELAQDEFVQGGRLIFMYSLEQIICKSSYMLTG